MNEKNIRRHVVCGYLEPIRKLSAHILLHLFRQPLPLFPATRYACKKAPCLPENLTVQSARILFTDKCLTLYIVRKNTIVFQPQSLHME
jgi:hypothetical protein